MQDSYVSERDRGKIPDKYKWDLSDIYSSDDMWRQAKKELLDRIKAVSDYRGRLTISPDQLCGCLELLSSLQKEQVRLLCYASMNSDLDTRDAAYMAMEQEMGQIATDFAALSSFVEPEILRMGRGTVERFIREEQRLESYRHILDDILRKQEHTGTESEEKIIADAGLMADSPGTIYSVFANADFPFPEITLKDGRKVRLDPPAFGLHRRSPVREDRKEVFAAFLGKMREFRRTFGAELYAEVRKNMFFARARRYPSCLERALDANNIPTSVYMNLIDGVRENRETLHRYLRLRKALLGVSELHYYDLYASLVKQTDMDFTYEEAAQHVLASLAPLGPEYCRVAGRALSEQWIDVYHNHGKKSGAYSNGAVYDVHPYMLLNYNGKYDDVSTLTHELGHTMHSYLANHAQPYHLSHYSIFVAEVASTFNEALLLEYMLKTVTEDEVRLSLLGNYLDGARATVFRQAQFAEFELEIHRLAEQGEALTGDLLSATYEKIARAYYGHDAGICMVDDEVQAEWAYIPHFYYNFYVYQYATSFTASSALADVVLAGGSEATRRYLDLLSSGGSDYPINLLKRAGVDMTTTQPLESTIRRMNRVMEELEVVARRLRLL